MCGLAGVAAAWVLLGGVVAENMAAPSWFYYRTYGGRDGDLNVPYVYNDLKDAVQNLDAQGYFGNTFPWNASMTVDCDTGDFHDNPSSTIQDYEFIAIHAHGTTPNCQTDQASFVLQKGAVPAELRPIHSRLKYGRGYLKWVSAQSCSWFETHWEDEGIYPLAMCNPVDCGDGIINGGANAAEPNAAAFRYFDYAQVPTWLIDEAQQMPWWYEDPANTTTHYLAEGATVSHTGIAVASGGGRYKRCKFNPCYFGGWYDDPSTDDRYHNANVLVLKVTAPGSSNDYKGRVTVRLGTSNTKGGRAADDVWAPNPNEAIATFDIYGSSGFSKEYRHVLADARGYKLPFGSFDGYNSCDLYLDFTNCTGGFTVDNLCFYYYPMEDDNVGVHMRALVDCHRSTMQGVHAIMGYSKPMVPACSNYSHFFERWLGVVGDPETGEAMSTALAYLSLGTWDLQGARARPVTRAVAVPHGPPGDKYYYAFETWADATDDPAPTGSCMILWVMPYFDQGNYWVNTGSN